MHLYSSRSLTEHYICLAQNKIKLTEKEMLVYVQKRKEKKETTRLYNGRKKDDNSQVKDEEKKSP